MAEGRPVEWVELYRAALVELDREKLAERIDKAEQAVLSRLAELKESAAAGQEQQALLDALGALRALRRLNSPEE